MPRVRKTLAALEASGALRKNPKRYRDRVEPVSSGPIGPPPDYFDKKHKACWYELIEEAPHGTLTRSDRLHLELTVRLLRRFRVTPVNRSKWPRMLSHFLCEKGVSPRAADRLIDELVRAIEISAGDTKLLAHCLGKMGMTPQSRRRFGF